MMFGRARQQSCFSNFDDKQNGDTKTNEALRPLMYNLILQSVFKKIR